MESRWREKACDVIQQHLMAMPADITEAEALKIISGAYCFGERESHPYKIWCSEVARQVALRFPEGKKREQIHHEEHRRLKRVQAIGEMRARYAETIKAMIAVFGQDTNEQEIRQTLFASKPGNRQAAMAWEAEVDARMAMRFPQGFSAQYMSDRRLKNALNKKAHEDNEAAHQSLFEEVS